jgi:hypothetical protein
MNFVVFSLGRTATQWLVHALNCHRDILCFHGTLPFAKDYGDDFDGYFAPIREIYWPSMETVKLTSSLTQPVAVWKPEQKPIESIKHIGNVHGLDPRRWRNHRGAYKGVYRCIQMTRHPYARLASMRDRWAHFEYELKPADYEAWTARSLASLANAGFPYEPDDLADKMFVCAVSQLLPSDAEFLNCESLPIIRTESLNVGALEIVTGLLCDAAWKPADLDEAAKIPLIDPRRTGDLTPKQVEFTRRLMAQFQLRPRYESLGYEV